MIPFTFKADKTETDYITEDGVVYRKTIFYEKMGTEEEVVDKINKDKEKQDSSIGARIDELTKIEQKTGIKFNNIHNKM
jgi:hypothetical protein